MWFSTAGEKIQFPLISYLWVKTRSGGQEWRQHMKISNSIFYWVFLYVLVKASKVEEHAGEVKVSQFMKQWFRISISRIKSMLVTVMSISRFDQTHMPANYYKTEKYTCIVLYVSR